ncbi:MAG: hypothetical protein EF813_02230 [Methanosarcinales archaeon]|nr:MAG: hypothetical protein EF813_02230 [Methanosarcinales archaeon]
MHASSQASLGGGSVVVPGAYAPPVGRGSDGGVGAGSGVCAGGRRLWDTPPRAICRGMESVVHIQD